MFKPRDYSKSNSDSSTLNDLEKQLILDEGMKLSPYKCTAGKTTIGVGRNLDDVGISEREAIILLRHDIDRVTESLDLNMGWYKNLSERRQNVLINMAFNMGLKGLMKFQHMLDAVKDGDYETAAQEMLNSRWASQVKGRANRLAAIMREG